MSEHASTGSSWEQRWGAALETICAHLGSDHPYAERGPFTPPIAQSTVFRLGDTSEAEALFSGTRNGYAYTRFGNPTVDVLARALARLEGGAAGLVASSGNAAVHAALSIGLARRPGPIVAADDLYGGTSELLEIVARTYRAEVRRVDAREPALWLEAVSNAAVVLLETPSNPLMRLIDIAATVEAAKRRGATVIVDNTVATPFNQQPLSLGADFVVHSLSKYLNGHSDMIGGCVVARDPFTKTDRAVHKNLGATVNALEAWLILRGLRTFALRMQAHNANGRGVAEWLTRHPAVARVYYPGLPGSPDEAVYQRQMRFGGGLLSFELKGGRDAALRFLDRMRLIVHAVSLGGMESLATVPAATSHRGMNPEQRRRAGVSDALVRLSVGTEALDDLIADLDQALGRKESKACASPPCALGDQQSFRDEFRDFED